MISLILECSDVCISSKLGSGHPLDCLFNVVILAELAYRMANVAEVANPETASGRKAAAKTLALAERADRADDRAH